MKVTLTCEKCGATVYVCEHLETGAELDQVLDIMDTNDVGLPSCPNCAKLTYGPLTEEMVAEGLFVAGHQWARDRMDAGEPILGECDPYLQGRRMDMARFVLRLLHDFGPEQLEAYRFGTSVREWLLDLARQK